MSIFKSASCLDEICQSMEKQLVSNQLERQHGFQRLAKATQYLNQAAVILEKAGMVAVAQDITETLQDLANQLSDK
jgi:ABC-type branched-subunit amino acid transport system ATPase component